MISINNRTLICLLTIYTKNVYLFNRIIKLYGNQRKELQLQIIEEYENSQSEIYLPIAYIIKENLKMNRMYEVNVANQENTKIYKRIIKVCKGKCSFSDKAHINTALALNFLGTTRIHNFIIKKIKISINQIEVSNAAQVSAIRKHNFPSDFTLTNEMITFLSKNQIIYNDDFITLKKENAFDLNDSAEDIHLKITLEFSPSIIDSSTKIIQKSNINSILPGRRSLQSTCNYLPIVHQEALNKMLDVFDTTSQTHTIPLIMALIGSNGLCQNEISQRFTDLINYQLIKLDIADLWNSQTSTFDPQLIDHFLSVHAFTPCLLHITNFGMFGKRDGTSEQELCTIQKLAEFFHNMSSSVVALLEITNSEYLSIPESIKSQLCFEISLVDLQETDRYEIFYHYTSCSKTSTQLSKNTLGFGYNELMKVIEEASLHFNFKKYSKKEKIYLSRKPDLCDYLYAIEKRNKCLVSSIGVPTIPNVQWADIGGLEETKALLEESLGISKKRKNENVKRSGIVLYGPPGCGKTMIAKAVANEFNITFLSVKGPELLNQYIGQSEENVRKLFEKARQASPCIIFLDEMDSLAPAKGRSGDSGGVMDRVVSQLLSELDIVNCTKNCQVFVMAATNRPDLLNQTLLSPGRFDKTVYVEPSNDVSSKLKVLEAVTRKVKLSPSVNLEKIANLLPPVMSGADIYSLVSNAVMELLRQQIKALQNGQTIEDVTKLVVEDDHIQSVIKKIQNSISDEQISHYTGLQNKV